MPWQVEVDRQQHNLEVAQREFEQILQWEVEFWPDADIRLQLQNNDEGLVEVHRRWEQRIQLHTAAVENARTQLAAELLLAKELDEEFDSIDPDEIPTSDKDENEMKTINKFMIGADPEFMPLHKGVHRNVNGFVDRAYKDFHVDHDGDVLEINPEPSMSSYRLTRNIRRLLTQHALTKKLMREGFRFQAGAIANTGRRTVGLGGHVHIDVPLYSKKTTRDHYDAFGDLIERGGVINVITPEAKAIIDALDKVTERLEKLDILPTAQSDLRRKSTHYGKFGDVRQANNANRLEYRTMCSWLHSPIATMLALTVAKLAAADPSAVDDLLHHKGHSEANLRKFFEAFATKDLDAKRVVERIFEQGVKLQGDPTADLLRTWKSIRQLEAA